MIAYHTIICTSSSSLQCKACMHCQVPSATCASVFSTGSAHVLEVQRAPRKITTITLASLTRLVCSSSAETVTTPTLLRLGDFRLSVTHAGWYGAACTTYQRALHSWMRAYAGKWLLLCTLACATGFGQQLVALPEQESKEQKLHTLGTNRMDQTCVEQADAYNQSSDGTLACRGLARRAKQTAKVKRGFPLLTQSPRLTRLHGIRCAHANEEHEEAV